MALGGLAIGAVWPSAHPFVGGLGGVLVLVDWLVASPLQNKRTMQAANVQEQFDTYVLGLPWKTMLVGSKLDPEDVTRAAARYGPDRADLSDWYPATESVPSPYNVLICQRTNLRWDMSLRQSWAAVLVTGLVVLCLLALAIRLWGGLTFWEFLFAYLPLAAALRAGATHAWAHCQQAREQAVLKQRLEGVWEQALRGREAATAETVRDIQDRIYALRISAPPVPDQWHRLVRGRHQAEMHESAARMAAEYNDAG